jgi:hypothetical protein
MMLSVGQSNSLVATGTTFLGTGYDMLHGSPEGGDLFHGGLDPGLKSTRQILAITKAKNDACPVEATCALIDGSLTVTELVDDLDKYSNHLFSGWVSSHDSAVSTHGKEFVKGGKSKIRTEVKRLLEEDQGAMVVQQTWKYVAEGTYKYNSHQKLDSEFQTELCKLPHRYNEENKAAYVNFLQRWGTHVIVHAQVGEKSIGHLVYQKKDYVSYLFNSNVGAVKRSSPAGGDASYSVSSKSKELIDHSDEISEGLVKYVKELRKSNKQLGSQYAPVPLNVELVDLSHFAEPEYVDLSDDACRAKTSVPNLVKLKNSLVEAITAYLGSAGKPAADQTEIVRTVPEKDISVVIWPAGSFSLLKTKNGCPEDWEEGSRVHDLKDNGNATSWSESLRGHIDADLGQDVSFRFCTKKHSALASSSTWEAGSYCFFKKGKCPTSMNVARILVNDEDSSNSNKVHGEVPDGRYDTDSQYYTCCRKDGDPDHVISLPNKDPFYLLPVKTGVCQQVRNMVSEHEWIVMDEEDDHHEETSEIRPWTERDALGNIKIHLCYYTPEIPA